jgi:tripeptidyl-peptidase-1
MSEKEVLDMIAPPAADSQKVVDWVYSNCQVPEIALVENRRDTVRVEVSASCVKKLFPQARLGKWKHTQRVASVVRLHPESGKTEMPEELKSIVEMVIGMDMLPVVRKKKVKHALSKFNPLAMDYIYPGDMNRVYNIKNNTISPGSKSTQAVIEFYPEGAPEWTDLRTFDEWSNVPFTNFSKIIGPFAVGNDGESLLDIQLISAVAHTATTYITVQDSWAYGMAQQLFSMDDAPLVNSVSYGWPEANTCQDYVTHAQCKNQNDPKAYVLRSETELQKAGAKGLSFSICSQDEGAPSEANIACQYDKTIPVWPIYPGCSAFATSVSATTLLTGNNDAPLKKEDLPEICNKGYTCSSGTTEVPCSVNNTNYRWTTGGGFSNFVTQPSWQSSEIYKYLQSGVPFPPANAFVKTNRAYPDVSAFGARILVVANGQISVSAGTSAATPIVAGIMTLINEARFNAGKPQIGFWNPALYKMFADCPTCFNKVPYGNNKCTEGNCCEYGYTVASSGTNAVTGLGTLNVQNAINYMVSL